MVGQKWAKLANQRRFMTEMYFWPRGFGSLCVGLARVEGGVFSDPGIAAVPSSTGPGVGAKIYEFRPPFMSPCQALVMLCAWYGALRIPDLGAWGK